VGSQGGSGVAYSADMRSYGTFAGPRAFLAIRGKLPPVGGYASNSEDHNPGRSTRTLKAARQPELHPPLPGQGEDSKES